ncbi:MAG: ABC transporter ATP-binding protein [Anaerolineaceae bacterium]
MAIIIQNLTKDYRQGNDTIEAVRGVNLSIEQGEFIVLLGPSGGGKSTFLNLLGGIDRPTSGSIIFNGVSLEKASEDQLTRFRRDNIGFIFQFYNLLTSLTALENVMLPLMAKGEHYQETKKRAEAVLINVGLEKRLHHTPLKLSGGEQQRVAIARAIIAEPVLVIADEPTGDLDSLSARGIVNLLHDLNKRFGITFLVATHNLTLCERADRVLEIKDGVIHA